MDYTMVLIFLIGFSLGIILGGIVLIILYINLIKNYQVTNELIEECKEKLNDVINKLN